MLKGHNLRVVHLRLLTGLLAAVFAAGCATVAGPEVVLTEHAKPVGEQPAGKNSAKPALPGVNSGSALPSGAPGQAFEPEAPTQPSASNDGGKDGKDGEFVEVERGLASWYGKRFHGKKTASGETYDMHELTAAHRSLPFGTVARVRSLVNGKEVDVRINDRGPFARGRIIDLSHAAAEALGMLGRGVKNVVILAPSQAAQVDQVDQVDQVKLPAAQVTASGR